MGKEIIMTAKTSELNSEIRSLLKQFKLPDIHEKYDEEVQVAIDKDIGYREFLYKLLKIEEEGKRKRLMDKNIKKACFDKFKTIEDFDFNFPNNINKSKILDLATLR
jgi:DNA replication protein DnaC